VSITGEWRGRAAIRNRARAKRFSPRAVRQITRYVPRAMTRARGLAFAAIGLAQGLTCSGSLTSFGRRLRRAARSRIRRVFFAAVAGLTARCAGRRDHRRLAALCASPPPAPFAGIAAWAVQVPWMARVDRRRLAASSWIHAA